MKVLLILEEEKIALKTTQLLNKNRSMCLWLNNTEQGMDEILTGFYDAVILGSDFTGDNGFDFIKKLRKAKISLPILMLSPKCNVTAKVRGLNSGVDDFLEYPYASKELLARLYAISRRKGEFIADNLLYFEDVSLNVTTYELFFHDKKVYLPHKEFDLIKLFFLRRDGVISKEELLTKFWPYDCSSAINSLEVHLVHLRKKFKEIGCNINIRCVRNVGYRLVSNK